VKKTLTSPRRYPIAQVGLESWSQVTKVSIFQTDHLKYQRFEGAFEPWAGKDDKEVNPSMCGSWNGATAWKAGQNDC